MSKSNIVFKTTAELIDELSIANIKCFMAQEDIMCASNDATVAKAAKDAQKLNARRSQLIRAINERLGESDITQTEKTYE